MTGNIFKDVRYHISTTLSPELRTQLGSVLDAQGATAVKLSSLALTHLITVSLPTDDNLESLPQDTKAHLVTPRWVERSRILGAQQDPDHYSPDPAMLFSGITATASDISQSDTDIMSAAIAALGGQWRTALTRDVTHLFALAPGSVKYETAMHFRDTTGMCVLVPHWFDDSVRLGIKGLPTKSYEWPEPRVFHARSEGRTPEEELEFKIPAKRRLLYDTALMNDGDTPPTKAPSGNVWNGLRILLSTTLELSDSQRAAHEADIIRQGGVVVGFDSPQSADTQTIRDEELKKIDEADVFVTRYRTGAAYVKAFKLHKTIGNISWLWFVRLSGVLSRPTDQLLHYPLPKKPIENFSSHVITITNYTGRDREYLKKLIAAMGAVFTPNMTGSNTVLIAAYMGGPKTTKAVGWSIPIVNHTWLEDCFVQWHSVTPARDKYIVFPPGVDFSTLLAERGVGRVGWEPAELEALALEENEDDMLAKSDKGPTAPSGTANSAREVENVVTIASDDEDIRFGRPMDIDVELTMKVQKDGDADMEVDDEVARNAKLEESAKANITTSTAKTRGKVVIEASEHESAATSSLSPQVVPKKLVRRYGRPSGKAELSSSQPESPPPRMYAGRIAKQKTSGRVIAREEEEESESDHEHDADPSSKKKSRKPHPTLDHDADVEMDGLSRGGDPSEVIGSLSARKGKAVPKPKKPLGPSDTEEDGDVEQILRPHRKAKGRLSHSTLAPSSSPHAPVSPTKSTHTPKRRVSVLVPTVASLYSSPSKRQALPETPRDSTSSNKLVRTRSIRAEAAEEPSVSPTKRVQPTTSSKRRVADKSGLSESTLPHKASRVPVHAADATSDQAPSSSARLTRTPSKRSAATKATQKLHDEIMPDVMNFQRELKNGTVRATWETGQTPAASKSKTGETGGEEGKTKANKRRSTGGDESSAFNEDEPDKKRRRTISTTKAKGHPHNDRRGSLKGKLNEESSEDEANEIAKGRKSRNTVKIDTEGVAMKTSSTRTNPKTIRIMTTQINLSDDVTRALTRMGAKMTSKPAECTHLIAPNLVRTEKFLCAMPVAPFIVTEKWAVTSAAARQFLPEADYVLADPENEKRFGFKLTDALHRAKANGKIFAGMTFYVTPKVPIAKLLRNVVVAGGGQLHIQVPTMRILNGHDHRYVISSSSELSTCRPLVEHGYPIYSQELILTGALRQEIDWDDPAYKVVGSFDT